MQSKNDGLLTAIYDQKCTDGEFKSIAVIVGTIVGILLVGIICCCQNRYIEKKLRVIEKGRDKI
jgi:nitrate reductase gamma subunit